MLAAVTVTNVSDVVNGNTSSIVDLIANDGGDGISLREAIVAANADIAADTIDFDSALDGGTILLALANGQLPITQSLSIDASSLANGLTIMATDPSPGVNDGDGMRIFNIDDNSSNNIEVELRSLTLTGGDIQFDGGAIWNSEDLTVADSLLLSNAAAGKGGALFVRGAANQSVLITNTLIDSNSANAGGGLYIYALGDLSAEVVISDSTISNNEATGFFTSRGGGFAINSSGNNSATIQRSTISGNFAEDIGGGGYTTTTGGYVKIHESTIEYNTVKRTGTDEGVTVFHGSGGGLEVKAFFDGMTVISGSTIAHNTSYFTGGGLQIYGRAEVINTTISGNLADGHGGGIWLQGAYGGPGVRIAHSTITGNIVDDFDGEPPGHSQATLGGGIFFDTEASGYTSTVTLDHTIIAGNADLVPDDWRLSPTEPLLPSHDFGLELQGYGIDDLVVNAPFSIVGSDSGPMTDKDIYPLIIGGRLVLQNLVAINVPVEDLIDTSLAFNGGPTKTHALFPGSQAVDVGNPSILNPPQYDQRGDPFARIFNDVIDIGSVELQPDPDEECMLLGDYNENGVVDAADYTVWRDTLTAGGTELPNDPTPGTVDESDFLYWRSHFGEICEPPEEAPLIAATSRSVIASESAINSEKPSIAAHTLDAKSEFNLSESDRLKIGANSSFAAIFEHNIDMEPSSSFVSSRNSHVQEGHRTSVHDGNALRPLVLFMISDSEEGDYEFGDHAFLQSTDFIDSKLAVDEFFGDPDFFQNITTSVRATMKFRTE
jgi:hypothetical protein